MAEKWEQTGFVLQKVMALAFRMRGQGATEYLVLLAVVLIIALVSIALLGFFPGLASDAKITQSNSYWRGDARPFAIIEHSISNGTVTLVMQSNEGAGVLRLTNVTVGDVSYEGSATAFAPGDTRTITISNYSDSTGMTSGSVYDASVVIRYTTANNVNMTQYGAKTLVGKFS
jgi:hypothetical protein